MSGPVLGTVYLLHFIDADLKPAAFGHARHYTGWSIDLPARLAQHDAGRGARLTEVAREAGLSFVLTRTWPGVNRSFERSLKNRGSAARYCPACGVHPKPAVCTRNRGRRLRTGPPCCATDARSISKPSAAAATSAKGSSRSSATPAAASARSALMQPTPRV